MLSERIKLDRGFPLCVAGPSPGAQRGSGGGRGKGTQKKLRAKLRLPFENGVLSESCDRAILRWHTHACIQEVSRARRTDEII